MAVITAWPKRRKPSTGEDPATMFFFGNAIPTGGSSHRKAHAALNAAAIILCPTVDSEYVAKLFGYRFHQGRGVRIRFA